MKQVFLYLALLFYVMAYGQSTCQNATPVTIGQNGDCSYSQHGFSPGQQDYWMSFTAPANAVDLVIFSDVNQTNPLLFTTAELQQGDCYTVIPVQQFTINSNTDTLNLTGLTAGLNYQIKLSRANVTSAGNFDLCAFFLAQDSYWTNNFTNSSGGTMLNCQTIKDIIQEQSGNQGCNEITICINDVLNLEIIAPLYISGANPQPNPCEHYFVFENQNGAIANPVPFTETYLTTLSFTQTGTVSFYLIPTYFPTNGNFYQNVINDPEEDFLFTVHVVGEQPEAVWDNQIICADGQATLTALDFSTISNVTVDGIPYNSNGFEVTFNSDDFDPGVHTVNYSLTGACGTVNYTTTFTVLEDNNLTVTIDNCGNAVFDFTSCTLTGNFNATLTLGDGTVLTGSLVNGEITFTHHYTTTNPVNWNFVVEYPNGIDAFQQSGSFAGVTIQPITISAPPFVCEMTTPITITNPASGLLNINWVTDPSLFFGGQGTYTLIPNNASWANAASDVSISVTATDANGCQYYGDVVIEECCGKKGQPDDIEYFENTYYTHSSVNGMNSLLPAGYYNAPTNVSINLPPAPATVINTQWSVPTTLSSLIVSAGWTVNAGVLNIPQTLYLNNDLIIDQSILIVASNYIRLAPNARIIVNPTVTFKMTNCTLAPKCEEMWGGVYAENANSGIVFDNVRLIGAKKGIEVKNSADLDVLSCTFVDNYIGIAIQDDGSAVVDKIRNTYFGDVTNAPLLFPYNNQLIPEIGVQLIRVKGMIVGSSTALNGTPASKGNLFHNMKRGVDGSQSGFSNYRNAFFKMQHAPGQPTPNEGDTYCGIRAVNFHGSNNTLNVGNTATDLRNVFVACDFGVSSKIAMNLNARYNYMREIRLRGISAEDNPSKTLDIYNNQINQTNPNGYGIYLKNYVAGTANVYYNAINNSVSGFFNLFARSASGIFAATVTPNMGQTTRIQGNTVRNALYGIWVLNVKSASVKENIVNIDFSTAMVNQLTANIANIRGIIAQNSEKVEIWNNTVNRNNAAAAAATNDQIQGIRIEICPSAYVWKNTMNRTAVGFYAMGSNIGSRVECNALNFNRNGFFMNAADISNQGTANGLSAHNRWTANLLDGTAGTTINHNFTPLYYYHASGASFNSDPTTFIDIFPYNWEDFTLSGTVTNTCGSALTDAPVISITPVETRNRELGAVVDGGIIYDTLDAEMKHYLNQAALSRLQQNPALQNLGVAEDVDYQYYVLAMEQSQTNRLLKAQKAIAEKELDSAAYFISQLDANDPKIALNKLVETIWNNANLGDSAISVSDSAILYSIACGDPLVDGSAVYQARAILDWDGTCAQMMQRNGAVTETQPEALPKLVIYPNPSNGVFNIESDREMEKVEIIDLKGAVLRTFNMNTTTYEVKTQLIPGIYVVRISTTDGHIETHHIAIQ